MYTTSRNAEAEMCDNFNLHTYMKPVLPPYAAKVGILEINFKNYLEINRKSILVFVSKSPLQIRNFCDVFCVYEEFDHFGVSQLSCSCWSKIQLNC